MLDGALHEGMKALCEVQVLTSFFWCRVEDGMVGIQMKCDVAVVTKR